MKSKSILQSLRWEHFQKSLGRETRRIDGNILLIKHNLPFGLHYWFIPEGPDTLTDQAYITIVNTAKDSGALFVRIEPRAIDDHFSYKKRLVTSKPIHPQDTAILDLSPSAEELLKGFKQKTRYNVGIAQKRGVGVETTTNPENIKIFYQLLLQTTARDKIKGHDKEYYKKMIEVLRQDDGALLYLARYQNTYIAAQIVVYHQDTAIYLHGASSNEFRNVMAPYYLQWQAICDAKKRGYRYYDFFGITKSQDPGHPWQGITRFKLGFTDITISYPGCFDVPIRPLAYALYKIIRRIRS